MFQVLGNGDCLPESIVRNLTFHETHAEEQYNSDMLRRQVVIWIARYGVCLMCFMTVFLLRCKFCLQMLLLLQECRQAVH